MLGWLMGLWRRWQAAGRAQWHPYLDDDGVYWWRREKNGVWQFKAMTDQESAPHYHSDAHW